MGLLNLPRIPRGSSPEQMANIYNMAIEEMEHRINGFLQSNNVQEVGGWYVKQDILVSKDGDVGMSTEDTGGDDVRLFAGGTDKDTAPWKVHQSGKMEATGAVIQSSDGYPKIVLDPDSDILKASTNETSYVSIEALSSGDVPAVRITDGTVDAFIEPAIGKLVILTVGGSGDIQISSGKHVEIFAASGFSVKFDDWDRIYSVGDAQNLQTALNAKANAFSGVSGTVYVASSSGGSPTTAITFSNGIRTS